MHKLNIRPLPIWSALAVIALGTAVRPADAQHQSPPPAAQPKPFALPSHHDTAFDNGLKLTTAAYGSLPKAAIELVIRGGESADNANQTWLSDLVGTSLGE